MNQKVTFQKKWDPVYPILKKNCFVTECGFVDQKVTFQLKMDLVYPILKKWHVHATWHILLYDNISFFL